MYVNCQVGSLNPQVVSYLSEAVQHARREKSVRFLLSKEFQDFFNGLAIDESEFSFSHFFYLLDYEMISTLSGANVLEIGGSISESFVCDVLKVKSWISVQKEYSSKDINKGNNTFSDLSNKKSYTGFLHPYGFTGVINQGLIPENSVERIFSLACFEHVHDLSETLDAAYKCLKPNGTLYSYFTPIWASESSHLPAPHQKLNFPYYHLINDFSSMYYKLLNFGLSDNEAYRCSLEHYKGDALNRYTYEDYELIFSRAKFEQKSIIPINKRHISELDPSIQVALSKIYPKIKHLATGFKVIFTKKPV